MRSSTTAWCVFFVCLLPVPSYRPESEQDEQRDDELGLTSDTPDGLSALHSSPASDPSSSLAELVVNESTAVSGSTRGDDVIESRPTHGKGVDVVQFSVRFKDFFGMDFKDGSFTADIVLGFRWTDKRAAKIVPASHDSLTLSPEAASKKIWMPKMAITSRDIEGVDTISTAVVVKKNGEVEQIQRVIAHQKSSFSIDTYPFDSQILTTVASSSEYMANEVELQPIPDDDDAASAVMPDALVGRGFTLDHFLVEAVEEKTGPLLKSRGKLHVHVRRSRLKWYLGTLFACGSLVVTGNLVFWLPMLPPFAMPRLGLSIISYLAMSSVFSGYLSNIAGVPGVSWGELFIANFQFLLFLAVITNVMLEFCAHSLKLPELAAKFHAEMRLVFPCLVILSYIVCDIWWTRFGSLPTLIVVYVGWVFSACRRVKKELPDLSVMQSVRDIFGSTDEAEDQGASEQRAGTSEGEAQAAPEKTIGSSSSG